MLRLLLISCIVMICVETEVSRSYAQERNIAPYFGASGSIDPSGNGSVGWGTEVGTRLFRFYIGTEYGIYSYRFPTSLTTDPTPGSIHSPWPISTEEFWGVHAGYVFNDKFYVGIVVLKSYETWEIATSDSTSYTTTRSYLNLGPDFRYSGIDDGHIYLAFAFTIRRGLKAGLGYMF